MKWSAFALLAITAAIAVAWAVGQWRWSIESREVLGRLEAARVPAAPESFDRRELDGLPPPVARHLARRCRKAPASFAPSTSSTAALST